MAILSNSVLILDTVAELSSVTTAWAVAFVKADSSYYVRNATTWIRQGSFLTAQGTIAVVTQATNKTTGVTLSTMAGDITLNAASLAAATIVAFTLTNTLIAATDLLHLQHQATGTFGAYTLNGRAAAGSAIISIRNNTAGALAEAIAIRFGLIKGVAP